MIGADTYGAPNWVDLSTSDVEGAIEFYSTLLGWTVTRSETPMGVYAIGAVGDLEVGGMMEPLPADDMPPTWTVFFYVEDVDTTAATVQAAGGSVLQPAFDLPAARVAVVADPTGGMFGIIGGPPPAGAYLDQGPGTVSWVELLTRDPRGAEPFYAEVFGWTAGSNSADEGTYTMFTLDGDSVAGMMMMPDQVPADVPAYWSVYFAVDDLEATVARATERGGSVIAPPMTIGGSRFTVLEDPQGAVFSLLERIFTE
jgi:uncharacterized protein